MPFSQHSVLHNESLNGARLDGNKRHYRLLVRLKERILSSGDDCFHSISHLLGLFWFSGQQIDAHIHQYVQIQERRSQGHTVRSCHVKIKYDVLAMPATITYPVPKANAFPPNETATARFSTSFGSFARNLCDTTSASLICRFVRRTSTPRQTVETTPPSSATRLGVEYSAIN